MLDDNKLYCIQCGKERELGRRYCKECHKKFKEKDLEKNIKLKEDIDILLPVCFVMNYII